MAGTISYFNLTGGLNTIQGLGTINQSNKRTESPDMKNVEYYKLGGLISMNGNTQFGDTFDSPISLGYEYIYGNNKYMIVVTTNSEVFIYDKVSGSFKLIFKFENQNKRHSICSFNNGIVMSNGIDDLVFYQYGRKDLIATNVSTTGTDNKVTGTNTKFSTELSVGDYIIIGTDENTFDNKYRIVSIESDIELSLDRNYPTAQTSVALYLSDLSACNAVFKTQGDNPIETNVRGLALNSYNGRIFVGGTDGILYYSEVGLIHGWSQKFGAGAIPAFYDDNSDFTALGLFDKYLIIFKRERCYLLDGNDVDDTNWTVTPYSLYTCDSQQSWIDADSSLLVYSRNAGGIYPVLKRTIYNPIFQGSELSMKIRDSFQFINEAMFDYIFPVYHPEKKYVMFYVPLLTGKGSNTAFIYDVTSKTWLKREVPQSVTIAFRFDNEIYIGTADGKILKEFSGLSFDGSPIEFYWKSPSFTFGQGTNFLSAREFRIKMSEEYTNNFRVRNSRDGKTTYTERKINSNENAFIGLEWDIDYNGGDLNLNYINEENSIIPDGLDYRKLMGDYFTIVGSSIITNKGIASGFSSRNFIRAKYIPLGQNFKIYLPKFNSSDVTTVQTFFKYSDNDIRAQIFNGKIRLFRYTSTSAYDLPVGKTSLTNNQDYYYYIEQTNDNDTYKFKGYISTDGNDWSLDVDLTSVNPIYAAQSSNPIEIGCGTGLSPLLGSIDLKQLSITVDGKEVFNGMDVYDNYKGETITDTVWDEDSWVVSSYITKRFPLMNQIFQTMSIEFYGNGLNDGMCIYGFEIDGVQLEEVPW